MRTCKECGKPFQPRQTSAMFCTSECRGKFNRRRRDRGTVLYDFIMAQYRGEKVDGVVKRLCEAFATADKAMRDGRESFQPVSVALANLPVAYGAQGDKR